MCIVKYIGGKYSIFEERFFFDKMEQKESELSSFSTCFCEISRKR